MIERIAMRFLNDDFGLHPGQIRELTDESFVIASENASQSRLNGCRCAGGYENGVAVRKLQHFRDALACGNLKIRNTYEVLSGHGHHGFEFRSKNRTAQHRHRSL